MTMWEKVLRHLQGDLVAIGNGALDRLPAIVVAIVVLAAAALLARTARRSFGFLATQTVERASLRLLIERFTAIGIWLVGGLIAALLVFPGLRLGDVVAALGLGTVAVGFAFADVFKNFLAGTILLFSEPFCIGDVVRIAGYEGSVEHVDIRSTHIRTHDGERVLLPNALVFSSPVQVRTAFALRRTEIIVRIPYGSDLALARATVLRAAEKVAGIADASSPSVDAAEFDENAILLALRYWTASTEVDVVRVRGEVILAVEAALKAASVRPAK
ncbi:MAG: mechanosensitive ion channel family protein [Candidatus Baltobacteraceae bacterium]